MSVTTNIALTPGANYCSEDGTKFEVGQNGVVQVTEPNGNKTSVASDNFTFTGSNGANSFHVQVSSATPPNYQSYNLITANPDDVANAVAGYAYDNNNTNSPTPPANGSGSGGTDNVPGSSWAKKIDELYAKLESGEKLSTEDMQKLQMQMQQAMQMFQLYTQMMTAMHEAKKDAGRQIRY
jgi:hypothetical protein